MKLEDGRTLLTIKDLARWIAFDRSEPGIAKALRQIRHWTENDFLRTVSPKKTGKGVPRFYEEEPTFQIAAILAEVSRYSPTLEVLGPVAMALYADCDEEGGYSFYLGNSLTDENVYMQVSWVGDPHSGQFTKADVRFWNERDNEDDAAVDPHPSSSVLINLTQVMARVYDNVNTDRDNKSRE